jgi:DNA-directed RNA polymerase specialized sigma24 family protein
VSLAAEGPIFGELQGARGGDREAMGRLLESCRDDLRMVADREIDADLAAKGAATDLVQEALLAACRSRCANSVTRPDAPFAGIGIRP